MGKMEESKKSTFGLDKNVAATGTYLLGWVTGLIFLLVEREDKDIRFHAVQSIIFFGGLNLLAVVPLVGWILSPFLGIVGLVGWIFLLVKTYQGEKVKLPVIGDLAEKWSKR